MKTSYLLHLANCVAIGAVTALIPIAVGYKLLIAVALTLSCGIARSLAAAGK